MNLRGTRITLRLHRFELVAFGAALILLSVALLIYSAYLASLQPGRECLVVTDIPTPACDAAFRRFNDAQQGVGGLLMQPLIVVVYVIGLFLGVPVVGRELERGTVRLAWSLGTSRWRWFVARMVPILAIVAILTFLAGVAADQWFAASNPGLDTSKAFGGYGVRGGLLASRAIFIFAIAILAGAVIGRALPAVIISAVVATVGVYGGLEVQQRILVSEAVAIPVDQNESQGFNGNGSLYMDQKFVLADGTLVGYEYFSNDGNGPVDEFGNPKFPMVNLVVPGERYRFVETREAVVLAGGSVVGLLLAGFVVSRRRPG
jgi:ABC-type transport system involved in multi-copper enzyme maturation permease subunit